MKRTLLVNCIAYFFILLFLYTGIVKLTEIHLFREQLTSSPLLGALAGIIAWALPIGEIILAIALFLPAWQLRGLYATLVLMSFFTVYVVIILVIDNHLSCSCGGIIEELSPKQHILFNSACVILSGLAIAVARYRRPTLRFKWLINASAIALFLVVGSTLFTAFSAPVSNKTGLEGRLLPSFSFQLADSLSYLNTDDIPTGKPFIFIGFSPWCTHCQAETRSIIQHIDQFKSTHIYFVTAFPFNQMKVFYQYFQLARYPNITVCRDSTDNFLKYFRAPGVPYAAIFDSHKRLKEAIANQADANRLAQRSTE